MIYLSDGLDCAQHPSVLLAVTVHTDGQTAIHSHLPTGEAAAVLAELVEQMRAELLRTAGSDGGAG